MRTRLVRLVGTALLAVIWATVARAQSTGAIEVIPYAGYMVFGKHLEGPIGTSIATTGAPIYGAQLGLNFSRGVGIVGNFSYGSSDLELGLPILGGLRIGESTVMAYDAALQLRAPTRTGVSPFVQGGFGALSYDITGGPFEISATNVAWVAGAGVDADLGKSIGIRLMARDYIGKFDFRDATGFEIKNDVAHNFTVSAGLRIRM